MSVKVYSDEERKELNKLARKVNKLSVAEIATNVYGLTLYSKKNNKRYMECYEHPSLVFDMKKNLVFYNAKTSHGMNAYDFISFYENTSFVQAREKLNDYYKERDPRQLTMYKYNTLTDSVYKFKGLNLPSIAGDELDKLYEKFDREWVDKLHDNGLLYQTKSGNMVFVGYDENDNPAFGVEYGLGDKNFKIECDGSYTKVGWCFHVNSDLLIIADSPKQGASWVGKGMDFDVLASKDRESLCDTIEYAIEHYDWMNKHIEYERILFDLHEECDKGLQDIINQYPYIFHDYQFTITDKQIDTQTNKIRDIFVTSLKEKEIIKDMETEIDMDYEDDIEEDNLGIELD